MNIESSVLKFSIAKKMTIFGILIFIVILIMGIVKYNIASSAGKNFDIFKTKAVEGKFLVLEIEKELNYISRATRDIMLGNSFESNFERLGKSKEIILKAFDNLEETVKGTLDEAKKLEEVKDSREKTISFVDDGIKKMESLAKIERTPEVLANMYQLYRKDATPLANASRDAFAKIVKAKDNVMDARTKSYHNEMDSLINFIIFESILVLALILVALIFLTKDVVGSLNKFKVGLISFFDFLNKKSENIEFIDIKNSDEFGQMANLVNENVRKITSTLEEDKRLIDDASIVISRVKNGGYGQLIQSNTSNNTLNTLKNGVNDMILSTKNHFEEINKNLQEYAKYNYTKELKLEGIERDGVFDLLISDINKLRTAINIMLLENKKDGLTLDETSNTLLLNVDNLNKSSNDAAARLEETAAALEEVTSSISNSTLKIAEMSKIASYVTDSATQGEHLASKTTSAMEEINQKVNAINEAITVIDQIAFQTNILSLNAAVEAATAGEAGKGFAVVAQEVRNLASRSAEAAREIKNLVEDATIKANDGKNISNEMIKGYTNLNENISKTIDIISEISNSSREQQKGVEQINDAISSLDKQTQENASIANITNEIAKKTSVIAQKIVNSADEKEFEGKNSIKIEKLTNQSFTNVNTTKSTKPNFEKKIDRIEPKKNDDEWESF